MKRDLNQRRIRVSRRPGGKCDIRSQFRLKSKLISQKSFFSFEKEKQDLENYGTIAQVEMALVKSFVRLNLIDQKMPPQFIDNSSYFR